METDSATSRLVYSRAGENATRRIADDVILVPIRHRRAEISNVYTLNEVAAFVWGLLEAPRSVDELVEEIARSFEVGEAEARRDVEELLATLETAELVRAEEKGA